MRLWLYLSVLLVVVASTCFAAPEITAVPSAPRPGEVIFLTFHLEQELVRAACSWNGRSYQFRFHDADGRYSLALPVSASTRAGGHHATIYWKYTSGEMGQQAVEIEVKPRKFGVQHLRLSSSQESKYTAPETKREKELIGAALDLVSPERLWRGSFVMPVQGRLSTAYGLQRYVNGKFSYRHRGVDPRCWPPPTGRWRWQMTPFCSTDRPSCSTMARGSPVCTFISRTLRSRRDSGWRRDR
jgi:hypothetical protein